MESTDQELIIYIAVARGLEIIASYSSTHEDMNSVALEALKHVPKHSSHYTMGFDDIMIAFWRDATHPGLIYLLGCHSALTKERAWQVLIGLKESYLHVVSSRFYRSSPSDPLGISKKLEPRMRAIVQKERGKLPPKEDLVVYSNAPGAYLVRNPVDEEPPEDYVSFQQPKVEGRKTLQEELAELGDDESDSESDGSSMLRKEGSKPSGRPAGQTTSSRCTPASGSGQAEVQAEFPFQKAQAAAKKINWSMEVRKSAQSAGLNPTPPPVKVIKPESTWSMEYSDWSAKALQAQQHALETLTEKSSSGESRSSASRGGSKGSGKGHLLTWAQLRGDLPPHLLEMLRTTKSDDIDMPSSGEASPAWRTDQTPLSAAGSTRSDENASRSSPSGQIKKKSSPMRDLAANMFTWSDSHKIQRSSSKSQEYPARVSPEERLQREARTEVHMSPRVGFQPERSRPAPGRIADRAPSGLTWEEEIRRVRVSQGLAAPQEYASQSPTAVSDSGESIMVIEVADQKERNAKRAHHPSPERPQANAGRTKQESRQQKEVWKKNIKLGIIINLALLLLCLAVWLGVCRGLNCLN